MHNYLCREGGMSENLGEEGRDLAPTAVVKEVELIYQIVGEAPRPISAVSAVMPT